MNARLHPGCPEIVIGHLPGNHRFLSFKYLIESLASNSTLLLIPGVTSRGKILVV